nr:hypothetical protein [Tanacetum cinerariifolium]
MVTYLSKSDASAGFDQIVDFLNAQVIQKKVFITEDIIRQDLRLDDADGVDCLPNEEIFAELARMGYEKPHPKLTFYKVFFSAQWKFLIHTLIQCMSAKRTAWNEFSSFMASAIIYLAIGRKFHFSKIRKGFSGIETPLFATLLVQPQAAVEEEDEEDEVTAAPTPPSFTHKPTSPSQEPITSPLQAHYVTPPPSPLQVQPAPPSSPPQEQLTTTSTTDMTLLRTLLETCTTLSHKGRTDDVSAVKEVNAADPIVFDDEEVTMTMAQTLIKMKAKKARLLDEQIAKRLHDEEVKQAATRE